MKKRIGIIIIGFITGVILGEIAMYQKKTHKRYIPVRE